MAVLRGKENWGGGERAGGDGEKKGLPCNFKDLRNLTSSSQIQKYSSPGGTLQFCDMYISSKYTEMGTML